MDPIVAPKMNSAAMMFAAKKPANAAKMAKDRSAAAIFPTAGAARLGPAVARIVQMENLDARQRIAIHAKIV